MLYTIYFGLAIFLDWKFTKPWLSKTLIFSNIISSFIYFAYSRNQLSDFKPSGPFKVGHKEFYSPTVSQRCTVYYPMDAKDFDQEVDEAKMPQFMAYGKTFRLHNNRALRWAMEGPKGFVKPG